MSRIDVWKLWRLLRCLRSGALNVKQLIAQSGLAPATVYRLLEFCERKKLISIRRVGAQKIVALTEAGYDVLKLLDEVARRIHEAHAHT